MQSKTADFAPVPPAGKLDETYPYSLWFWPTPRVLWKHGAI